VGGRGLPAVKEWPTNLFTDPLLPLTITNLCQFSLTSAHFDPDTGATFLARLPEPNGRYTIELITTNGARLKTLTGRTTDGVLNEHWDLLDEPGRRFTNVFFNSVFHLTMPDSGRVQTLRAPRRSARDETWELASPGSRCRVWILEFPWTLFFGF
jgi:hypothetical protein